MEKRSTLAIAALGAVVIAITYGLARFVFGLFLPGIRDDLGLTAAQAGFVGAIPFASFIAGVLTGPKITERIGPREAGLLTTGLATLGLIGIAVSPDIALLSLAVGICGISTGLSSPVMADAVHSGVPPELRGRVNAIHNAGTSIGVAVAMPVSAYLLGNWRGAYVSFGALAAVVAIIAFRALPRRTAAASVTVGTSPHLRVSTRQWIGVASLSLLATGMGIVSSVYWIFGPDRIAAHGVLGDTTAGWMWLGIGIAGLLGSAAGDLIDSIGTATTHGAALILLATALGILAVAPESMEAVMTSAALFGIAYMSLTGLYLVQGIRLLANRPALGPVLPFLAVAVGTTIGSPLAGALIDVSGYAHSFNLFAIGAIALALLGGVMRSLYAVSDPQWN